MRLALSFGLSFFILFEQPFNSRLHLNKHCSHPSPIIRREIISRFSGLKIEVSPVVPEGNMALWKNGELIYIGKLGDPVEDAECDTVMLHPDDYARFV